MENVKNDRKESNKDKRSIRIRKKESMKNSN